MSDTQTSEAPQHPMKYVALKPLLVGDGWRQPGQEVPEAANWRNLQAYLNTFRIQAVPVVPGAVQGGVDFSVQGGRTNSSRPVHKPVHSVEGVPAAGAVSTAADLNKLSMAQIRAGLKEGSLLADNVERYETSRDKPRKGVLKDLGWDAEEIAQGHRHKDAPPERSPGPSDRPYEDWSEEELVDAWFDRYGEEREPPDDREGLVADLEAEESES